MFFLDPAALVCCVATCCCGAGSVCLYKKRRSIPHPSECSAIGKAYRFCGCHDHDKFDMLVEVHEILNVPGSGKYTVAFDVGRCSVKTVACEAKNGRVDIQERLRVHVRQADNEVEVRVRKQVLMKTDVIGVAKVSVKGDLIDAGFPKRQWYFCSLDGKTSCKVLLSFHRLDTTNVNLGDFQMSPLLHQALLHAQYEAEARGAKLEVDMLNMSEVERLRFLSTVLEGPLQQMRSLGGAWKDMYFRAVERSNGKWDWQYWDSKDDCMSGQKKKGAYSFLAISLVLPDRHDRQCFYVRYHDRVGVHDLFFKRVDRDRNLWTDGLFEFIEKLREYIDKHPEVVSAQLPRAAAAGGGSGQKQKHDTGGDASPRKGREGDVGGSATPRHTSGARGRSTSQRTKESRATGANRHTRSSSRYGRSRGDDEEDIRMLERRRMLSPRKTAADEGIRPRVSVLKNRMAQGLMYDDYDIGYRGLEKGSSDYSREIGAAEEDMTATAAGGDAASAPSPRGEERRRYSTNEQIK